MEFLQCFVISGFDPQPVLGPRPGMTNARLRPRPLVPYALEFHRAVRDRDPEGGADGAFHQMNLAAMGADQFGGDRQPQAAAAGPPRTLERLEQVVAGP